MRPESASALSDKADPTPVLRFAPSPNGFLHLGHAYSALMNQRLTERLGGILRLRFEDIDTARCRPDYEEAAVADLAWLGIRITPPIIRQSDRFPVYREALGRLRAAGLVYPCFCSRGDIARAIADRPDWPLDPDGSPLYPGTCRHLAPTMSAARVADSSPSGLRLDMAAALARAPARLGWTEYHEGIAPTWVAAEPQRWGDALLARKDIPTSYHVSVVVDDGDQGVTDVVRGEDLFDATGLHRLLQTLVGFPAPRYHHHRVLRDEDGAKLSKSRGDPALRTLRQTGKHAAHVRQDLGFASGFL